MSLGNILPPWKLYGNERLHTSAENLQANDYVILMAHSPSIIDFIRFNNLSYNLLLVGHTHGGQVRLFGKTVGAYKHFHVGMKLVGENSYFHINRGLGTVKIPVRLACSPEVSVFKL
jgi:predicted MPP superfamily phosphohydrolase